MVITAGSYDLLVEVVCESDEALLDVLSSKIRTHAPTWSPPRPSCTSSSASRPTRGVCAERLRRTPALALARHRRRRLAPRPGSPRRHRRGRRDRRRRAHRPLDRLLPAPGRPDAAGAGARGRDRRLRGLRPQRWLVLGALPGVRRPGWPRSRAPTGSGPSPSTTRCAATVDEVLAVCAREGIDAQAHKGGTVVVARTSAQLRSAIGQVEAARAWGRGPDEIELLDAATARARLDATGTVGGTYHPRLRSPAPCPPGPRAGPDRRAARCPDPRAHPGPVAGSTHGADRAGHRPRRRRRAGHRGLHPRPRRAAAPRRTDLLPDRRHRAAPRAGLGPDRAPRAGDLLRPPEPGRVRAAHRRRPPRASAAAARRTTSAPGAGRRSTGTQRASPGCARPSATCSRCSPGTASPTAGAGCSASRATGVPRSGSTATTGLGLGRAATSATASVRRTWPAGP